jgi:hypothetical protein
MNARISTTLTIAMGSLIALSVLGVAQAETVTIGQDPNAATGNFQAPGTTATVGYTINVSDDGTNFYVALATADPTAQPFANLYFDTIASTLNTGSNLGFEFGQNFQDTFIPGVNGSNQPITGTGVTSVFTVDANGTSVLVTIPNLYFLLNPLEQNFTPTPEDTLVSLHLSQSFGYSVVGGGGNYPAPVELGDAAVSSTPEPGTIVLFGTAITLVSIFRKRLMAR